MRRSPPSYIFFAAILFIIVFFGQREDFALHTEAKEIEATSEWTLLGENDTVPAGLHIKVDLTTGQKWAKLVDENEDDDVDKKPALGETVEAEVTVKGDATAAASLSVSTSSSSLSSAISVTEDAVSKISISDDDDKKGKDDSYDYSAMHRTLSNLPQDEKERMGGLPELPASYESSKLTAKEKAAFEKRMKDIWEKRQEELRKIQEDYVADLPKILRGRIEVLKSYVRNPSEHLLKLDLDGDKQEADSYTADDADEEKEEDAKVEELGIIETLKDLEYHLSDLDMARDFYTLGGWPYLVSLLSDAVHYRAVLPVNETSPELMEEVVNKINFIQSHAAWVLGTAVKNSEEFHGWATEKIILVEPEKKDAAATTDDDGEGEEARSAPLSAISLLVSAIKSSSSSGGKRYTDMERQKNLYALGALLRGNRKAQRQFIELGGPNALVDSVPLGIDSAAGVTAAERRYASKTLLLADDIVSDLVLHGTEEDMDEENVKNWISEFTSPAWCDLTIRLLSVSSVQIREKAVQSLGTMSPYCIGRGGDGEDGWRKKAIDAVGKVKKVWIQGGLITEGGEGADDGLDPVYRKELVELTTNVLDGLN